MPRHGTPDHAAVTPAAEIALLKGEFDMYPQGMPWKDFCRVLVKYFPEIIGLRSHPSSRSRGYGSFMPRQRSALFSRSSRCLASGQADDNDVSLFGVDPLQCLRSRLTQWGAGDLNLLSESTQSPNASESFDACDTTDHASRSYAALGRGSAVLSRGLSLRCHSTSLGPVSPVGMEGECGNETGDGEKMVVLSPSHIPANKLPSEMGSDLAMALFSRIKKNENGNVTWKEFVRTIAADNSESIETIHANRPYSLSRKAVGLRCVERLFPMPHHKTCFAVSLRNQPLVLAKRSTFEVVKDFSAAELLVAGGDAAVSASGCSGSRSTSNGAIVRPLFVEYLPIPDLVVSYGNDLSLRGWWNTVSRNTQGSLVPHRWKHLVRQLRVHPTALPHSIFTGDTQGIVVHWEVPRHCGSNSIRQLQTYSLHDGNQGGLSDVCVTSTHLFSTGYDMKLLATSIEVGRPVAIGKPQNVIRMMELSEMFGGLVSVGFDNNLLFWDSRTMSSAPSSAFIDPMRRHQLPVVGLQCSSDLPHIFTADSGGVVKVWDIRRLQCIQTFDIGEDWDSIAESDEHWSRGTKATSATSSRVASSLLGGTEQRTVNSLAHFDAMREVVCCAVDAVYCFSYNYRPQMHVADTEVTTAALYSALDGAFILHGSTRISVWNAQGGWRKRYVNRLAHSEVTSSNQEISSICLDEQGRRIFVALSGGKGRVEVYTTRTLDMLKVLQLHESDVIEVAYSHARRLLIAAHVDGTMSLVCDATTNAFSTSLTPSCTALHQLNLSDELGMVAFCDESAHLFFVELASSSSAFSTNSVLVSQKVRRMAFLDQLPLLATIHDGGAVAFWSCPPVMPHWVPLATFDLIHSHEAVRLPSIATMISSAARASTSAGAAESLHRHTSRESRRRRLLGHRATGTVSSTASPPSPTHPSSLAATEVRPATPEATAGTQLAWVDSGRIMAAAPLPKRKLENGMNTLVRCEERKGLPASSAGPPVRSASPGPSAPCFVKPPCDTAGKAAYEDGSSVEGNEGGGHSRDGAGSGPSMRWKDCESTGAGHLFSEEEESDWSSCALAFDGGSLTLLIGEPSGKIHYWRLARFLHDKIPRFFSEHPGGDGVPAVMRVSAARLPVPDGTSHDGPAHALPTRAGCVVQPCGMSGGKSLTWCPQLGLLLSCGLDRCVRLLDEDGTHIAQLAVGRLPAVVGRSDSVTTRPYSGAITTPVQVPASVVGHSSLPPYSLWRRSKAGKEIPGKHVPERTTDALGAGALAAESATAGDGSLTSEVQASLGSEPTTPAFPASLSKESHEDREPATTPAQLPSASRPVSKGSGELGGPYPHPVEAAVPCPDSAGIPRAAVAPEGRCAHRKRMHEQAIVRDVYTMREPLMLRRAAHTVGEGVLVGRDYLEAEAKGGHEQAHPTPPLTAASSLSSPAAERSAPLPQLTAMGELDAEEEAICTTEANRHTTQCGVPRPSRRDRRQAPTARKHAMRNRRPSISIEFTPSQELPVLSTAATRTEAAAPRGANGAAHAAQAPHALLFVGNGNVYPAQHTKRSWGRRMPCTKARQVRLRGATSGRMGGTARQSIVDFDLLHQEEEAARLVAFDRRLKHCLMGEHAQQAPMSHGTATGRPAGETVHPK